jgi:hypothetical protein
MRSGAAIAATAVGLSGTPAVARVVNDLVGRNVQRQGEARFAGLYQVAHAVQLAPNDLLFVSRNVYGGAIRQPVTASIARLSFNVSLDRNLLTKDTWPAPPEADYAVVSFAEYEQWRAGAQARPDRAVLSDRRWRDLPARRLSAAPIEWPTMSLSADDLDRMLGCELSGVVQALGLSLTQAAPLAGDGYPGYRPSAFRLTTADGRTLKGRVFATVAVAEEAEYVATSLPAGIVPPILLRTGAAMVTEWVDGTRPEGDRCTPALLRQCGALHATVHLQPIPEAQQRRSAGRLMRERRCSPSVPPLSAPPTLSAGDVALAIEVRVTTRHDAPISGCRSAISVRRTRSCAKRARCVSSITRPWRSSTATTTWRAPGTAGRCRRRSVPRTSTPTRRCVPSARS